MYLNGAECRARTNLQDNKMSDKQTEKTIQLDTPIKRGKTEITEIVLRKPQSGALRGTRLQAIMDMDVNAMMTVIPASPVRH